MRNKMTGIALAIMVTLGLALTGCNSNSSTGGNPPPPVVEEPVAPVEPPVEPGTPGTGIGAVNYVPSCTSGFAKVVYVYRDEANINANSFNILHKADGERQSITTGSVSSNGAISRMEQEVYIAPNDSDAQIAHSITVSYIANEISQVNSFAFLQPTCVEVDPVDPVDPTDPVDPVDPTDPVDPGTPYTSNTNYEVGDIINIVNTGNGNMEIYKCINAYRSGPNASWAAFSLRLGNWERIIVAASMTIEIQ